MIAFVNPLRSCRAGNPMATSKAWRARQYWEDLDDPADVRYLSQPAWLARARQQTSSPPKTATDVTPPQKYLAAVPVEKMISLTHHAKQRLAQRNLSDTEIGWVLLYGQTWHKAGAVIIYLRLKDLPPALQADQRWQQLVGVTVVLPAQQERVVLTAYRNHSTGLHAIKRKPDYGYH